MSIARIAQQLNLSPASVSRALNGQPGVSDANRARILAEAARIHFVPHGAARSLATTRSQQIGFVLYHLPGPLSADPFYSRIMLGVEEELRQSGYRMLLSMLDDEIAARPEQWSLIRSRDVDGLILAGPFVPQRLIVSLHTQGVPLVLVDNAIRGLPIDAVLGDDRDGARLAAEHMLGHGHTRIAVIAGPDGWYTTHERCCGFRDALEAAGLEPVATIHAEETTWNTGYAAARDALAHAPTAVLAVNDAMAMGAIAAVRDAGLRVPDDLAICGFDDIDIQMGVLPLTTVRLRKRYLGRVAARQLVQRLADSDAPQQRILITTELIVRRSCGCQPPEGGKAPQN